MTNEELAIKVQQGSSEYIGVLWEQIVDFINMQAGKYLDNFPAHYRNLRPDMVSHAYFYYLEAFEDFDPRKGKFLTWLSYFLKSAFSEVIYSGRSKRAKNDPLSTAVSLDIHLDDTEDVTLGDMLIDDTSEAYYRRIEDVDFWLSVNNLLNEAIDHIKDDKGRELVRYMFCNGSTIGAASKALYGDTRAPYEHYRKAIRQIRSYLNYSTVKKKMKAAGLDEYISGWGLGAWKKHQFTSSVEYIAVKYVDEEMKRGDMAKVIL